jgi:low temperature requirement protein LtrA
MSQGDQDRFSTNHSFGEQIEKINTDRVSPGVREQGGRRKKQAMLRIFRINTVPTVEGSTWLELFFDLIYVAILIEMGDRLAHDLTLQGVTEFALLFIPIFWSWLGIVFFTRYFPPDDIGQRILTVAYMAIILVMAFEIHSVTKETAPQFTLAYGISKIILVLMYARVWIYNKKYRFLTGYFSVIYTIAAIIWFGIALFAPTNFALWALALSLSVLAPALIGLFHQWRNNSPLAHPPVKHHYKQHRFGELTLIVLGEFFIKIVTNASGIELTTFNYFIGVCLLGISVGIWWLYFDHLSHASLEGSGSHTGFWMYLHYPLLAAIAAYGVVGYKIFEIAPGEVLANEERYVFSLALALAVLALGGVEWTSPEEVSPMARGRKGSIRAVSAVILIALALFGGQLAAGWFVILVLLVFLVQVFLDVQSRIQSHPVQSNEGVAS